MKYVIIIGVILASISAQAQTVVPPIALDFTIQSKNNEMGLLNIEKGTFELPMEKCFLYISNHSNALLKVKGETIQLFTYYADSLRMIYESQEKVLCSFSSIIDWKSYDSSKNIIETKRGIIDAETGKTPAFVVPRKYHIDSEFGVEVVEEQLVIQDRKMTGQPGNTPKMDEDPESPNFGDPLIFTDSLSGMQFFVYDPPSPSIGSSGIYQRNTNEWVIPTEYYAVTPTYEGYVLETRISHPSKLSQSLYEVYSHDGTLTETFDEQKLLENPQLFELLIPRFKCDSLKELSEDDLERLSVHLEVPILFYSDGKTGVYDWNRRDVSVDPKDLYIPLDFIDKAYVAIDGDRVFFFAPFFWSFSEFPEGGKQHLIVDYEGHPMDGGIAFQVTDNITTTQKYFMKESFRDPVVLEESPFEDKDFDDYMDFNAHCVLEHVGNGLVLVNHQQQSKIGTIPLIDEDPNSERFGEPLIHWDSLTGMQSFVYDMLVAFENKSGVFDLKSHSWIIPPRYYFVEAIKDGFITHTGDSNWMKDTQTTFDMQGNVIAIKEVGEDR